MISTAVSQDDLLYAAGGTNKVAKVWSRRDGREVASFMAAGPITSVIFISRGAETKLVVGTFGGHLHFFDVASGAEEKRHKFGKGDAVHCMAATSDFRNDSASVPERAPDDLSRREIATLIEARRRRRRRACSPRRARPGPIGPASSLLTPGPPGLARAPAGGRRAVPSRAQPDEAGQRRGQESGAAARAAQHHGRWGQG